MFSAKLFPPFQSKGLPILLGNVLVAFRLNYLNMLEIGPNHWVFNRMLGERPHDLRENIEIANQILQRTLRKVFRIFEKPFAQTARQFDDTIKAINHDQVFETGTIR